jgi:predicted nucleic acid-binding Zn ribbon protein
MLDEIIPLLKMPSPDRTLELEIYNRSRSATIMLMGVVVLLALVCFLLRR